MAAHKTEKRIIIATGAVLLLFLISVLYAKAMYHNGAPGSVATNKTYSEPKITKLNDGSYQVYAVASMWKIEPAAIRIPAGSDVEIFLTSKDIVHGLSIPAKNVEMTAMHGTIEKARVKFAKPGVYKISVDEYCGKKHGNMQAQVIVEERNGM
jgi:cytochrome c oxidase subunit II